MADRGEGRTEEAVTHDAVRCPGCGAVAKRAHLVHERNCPKNRSLEQLVPASLLAQAEAALEGLTGRIEDEIDWHRTEAAKARGYFESDPPEPHRSMAKVTAARHDTTADRLAALQSERSSDERN